MIARGGSDFTVRSQAGFEWPLGSGPFWLAPDGRSLLTVRMDPSPGEGEAGSDFYGSKPSGFRVAAGEWSVFAGAGRQEPADGAGGLFARREWAGSDFYGSKPSGFRVAAGEWSVLAGAGRQEPADGADGPFARGG